MYAMIKNNSYRRLSLKLFDQLQLAY